MCLTKTLIFISVSTRPRQILINNGYSNQQVDAEVKSQLDKLHNNEEKRDRKDNINLFYRPQMHTAYKGEERVMKNIIKSHVKCVDPSKTLNIIIYYNTTKTSSLVMINNTHNKKQRMKKNGYLQRTNVIYQYDCPEDGCRRLNTGKYIGATTTTLSRRLTMHLQEGAIQKHAKQEHGRSLTRKDLVENTHIIETCNDHRRIWVTEALYIREFSPYLNKQAQSPVTLALWS